MSSKKTDKILIALFFIIIMAFECHSPPFNWINIINNSCIFVLCQEKKERFIKISPTYFIFLLSLHKVCRYL